MNRFNNHQIAVAIPCYNEAGTIAKVVADFRRILPEAAVFVFDNNSSDESADLATGAGGTVVAVRPQGKGNVMRQIFDQTDADLLVVVDADDTYSPDDAPLLLQTMIDRGCDMVVGNRLSGGARAAFKKVNLLGNHLIAGVINLLFRTRQQDVLSGYRVFSRRFINRVALLTSGFETEVELTLRALEEKFVIFEVPVSYRIRSADSRSKLRPLRDGVRILITITMILRDVYPLRLYSLISLVFFASAFLAALLRLINYFGAQTLPNTVLVGLLLLFMPAGLITLGMGLILSAVNSRINELKQIMLRNKGR